MMLWEEQDSVAEAGQCGSSGTVLEEKEWVWGSVNCVSGSKVYGEQGRIETEKDVGSGDGLCCQFSDL